MGAPRAWGKKLPDYSTLSSPRHGLAGAEADEAVGTYSFGARTYDPTLRRWVSPDPLLAALPSLDESIGDNLNLYAYAGNNPVARIDLTGFEGTPLWQRALNVGRAAFAMVDPGAPLKALVADTVQLASAASQPGATLTPGGVALGVAQATAQKVENGVVGVATQGSIAAAVPKGNPKDVGPLVGKAIVNHVLPIVGMARAPTTASSGSAPKAELHRPYLRKATREAIDAAAPRDAKGRPLDPNTGKPIEGKPDIGHKTGNEFRREKAAAEAEGLSQQEFNDRMNEPSKYQLEDPSSNRSHRYEKKP